MKKIFDLSRGAPPLYTIPIDAFTGKYTDLPGLNETIEAYPDSLNYKGSSVAGNNFRWFGPLRELLGKKHWVHSDQIIVRNGWMDSMDAVFLLLNKKQDIASKKRKAYIVTECPSYDRFAQNIKQHNMDWDAVLLEKDGVCIWELEKLFASNTVDLFYGIYEGQNPSSYSYSPEKKEQVEALCKKYGVLLLWDGAYHNLTYGRKNESMVHIDSHIIYAFNFTKEVSAWAKVWYLVVWDREVADSLFDVVSTKWLNPVYPIEAWYYEFLKSKYYEENLDKLRKLYWERARKFKEIMNTYVKHCEFNQDMDSGYFVNVKFNGVSNHDAFIKKLKDNWIIVSDSRNSFHPKYIELANGVIRIPFAILDEDEIKELAMRFSVLK